MTGQISVPMISYWRGRPLSELPRDKLEAALVDAYGQIEVLRESLISSGVDHINDLARMARSSLMA